MAGDDLAKGSDEAGALGGLELVGEVAADAGQVNGCGLAEPCSTGRREHRERDPTVGRVGGTRNMTLGHEVIDQPADPRTRQNGPSRQLLHPQAATLGRVQLQEHVVPGQGDATRSLEVGFDGSQHGVLRQQQRPPGGDVVLVIHHEPMLSHVVCGCTQT
jgi:hypothetical protein